MKIHYNLILVGDMKERTERMRECFAPTTWMYGVMDGLVQTWKMMESRMELPMLDRGLSIQSAIRQTSANYYDTQLTHNVATYSQQAV
jgi:hypothetical protein